METNRIVSICCHNTQGAKARTDTNAVVTLALAPWGAWKHIGLFLSVVTMPKEQRLVNILCCCYTCLGSLGSMATNRIVSIYCHNAQGAKASTATAPVSLLA
jgi:hypothetical protein